VTAEERRLEAVGAARPLGGGDPPQQLRLKGALRRELGACRGVQSDQSGGILIIQQQGVRAHRPCLSAFRALSRSALTVFATDSLTGLPRMNNLHGNHS